jgi:hypothetical protein
MCRQTPIGIIAAPGIARKMKKQEATTIAVGILPENGSDEDDDGSNQGAKTPDTRAPPATADACRGDY